MKVYSNPLRTNRKTLLLISQVFVPDPAAVGQYMTEAAVEMSARGWQVKVLTANRGYEDPSVRYLLNEKIRGVEVTRLPLSSFGKKNLAVRIIGQLLFLLQCIIRGIFVRQLGGVFITTSPPMASIAALAISVIRRVPIAYWAMDINPDQAVAMRKFKSNSFSVKALNQLSRLLLNRARTVVTLDNDMRDKLLRKVDIRKKLSVCPPWPLQDHLQDIQHQVNPFREEHNLSGKFVIMYSGNHSPSHPLTTVLEAALRLQDQKDLVFVFIGGGLGKREIDEAVHKYNPPNILSLPYQPLQQIKYSLSAADIHLVTMGNDVVGCVHPSKIYAVMALGRPVLFIGPKNCHLNELITEGKFGWQVSHGEVDELTDLIIDIKEMNTAELTAIGQRAQTFVRNRLSKDKLCKEFCDTVEEGLSAA
jgi:colanic acid biosynthesis glycosyl transferase WcaI